MASRLVSRTKDGSIFRGFLHPSTNSASLGDAVLGRSGIMLTPHATLQDLYAAWWDISMTLGLLTQSTFEEVGRLEDTVYITRLAWRRWRSRLHASAIHVQELHVRLTGFIVTLRTLLGCWQDDPDRCNTRQLNRVWEEALELHVALKDIRRLPPSLGGQDIAPPVPLRLKRGCNR